MTRTPYQGAWQILQYNWSFYAAATFGITAVFLVLSRWPMPFWITGPLLLGVLAAAFWAVASLAVAHYVYDRTRLYEFDWLRQHLHPHEGVNIHAGLDETSLGLRAAFPETEWRTLDIYDPRAMTEPSIARARAITPPPVPATPADYRHLPLADSACDTVCLIFAAHELREHDDRLRFLQEVHRSLRPGGNVLVIEHLRDTANFLAFGPGFWHFLSRRTWVSGFRNAGFTIQEEFPWTPFVRVFLLRKPA